MEIRNPLTHYRWLLEGGNVGYAWINATGTHVRDIPDGEDFSIAAFPENPEWIQQGVVYQIFPDRFATSEHAYRLPEWVVPREWGQRPEGRGPNTGKEYFGGDLWGVLKHLDYLQALGIQTLYFTPFFPAGSTHRYDASTFACVDPLLGGDEALIALVSEAHRRGMRVLGDLTLNHSGNRHEWFLAAQDGRQPMRGFYSFDPTLEHGYECWLGVRTLPKFDYRSQPLRDVLIEGDGSVLRSWLRAPFHLDGWRIDVANMTARQGGVDLNHEIARAARRAVMEEGPDKVLVAEHFHDAGPDVPGDGWQGAMNYSAFLRPVWSWLRSDDFAGNCPGLSTAMPHISGEQMVSSIRSFAARMPWRSWTASWNILSSHDTARIRTVVGSRSRHIAAAVLMSTLPGVPMIFAGDELGAEGGWGEDARTTFPWATETHWDHDFHDFYRTMIRLRSEVQPFANGGLRWVYVGHDAVAYLRESLEDRYLVAVARCEVGEIRIRAQDFDIDGLEPTFGFHAQLRDGDVVISASDAGGGIWRVL